MDSNTSDEANGSDDTEDESEGQGDSEASDDSDDSEDSNTSDEASGSDDTEDESEGQGDSEASDDSDDSDDSNTSDEANGSDDTEDESEGQGDSEASDDSDDSEDSNTSDEASGSDDTEDGTPKQGGSAGNQQVIASVLDAEESDIRDTDLSSLLKQEDDNPLAPVDDGDQDDDEAETLTLSNLLLLETPVNPLEATLATRLAGPLEALLVARTEAQRHVQDMGRRVSTRHLARAMVSDSRIFINKTEGEKLDTHVVILGDVSWSMGYQVDSHIWQAAALRVTGEMLESLDVPFAVGLFDSAVYPVKEEHAPFRKSMIYPLAMGGTEMAAALYWAIQVSMSASEKRHVIILMTDGVPNNPPEVAAAVNEAHLIGIDVAPVFIGNTFLMEKKKERSLVEMEAAFPVPPQYAPTGEQIPAALINALEITLEL
ncbi:hypothetical protein BJI67_16315 (plasmid) [Acidihalobacter aeolianus]|uniref:VWFA domain-containing protein n=1 Tax=Acidihalobacter aeolianus TaxID=2792603 RepID=A0A1D8KCY7_9GAMM|nr:vWA domain-containing protein [Acidihalobacter aeolianus]AOV18802.1 hypothetical protein BJI67_16315 [Acidihalobacter aeolianus]